MPEWARTRYYSTLVGDGLGIQVVKLTVKRAFPIYIQVSERRVEGTGTIAKAERFALDEAERYLEHLLAQVRAMKEGTDASTDT